MTDPNDVAERTETVSHGPELDRSPPIGFAPGQRIRDYELLAKLGEGGMGTVWKARHVELDKTVAVKLLSRKLTNDATLVERFKREMKAVGKLEHAHLVRALDGGEFQGTHFLVLEHFDGQDLSQFVKERGPRSVLEACELLRQAALGLEYAHTHGVVHRDIKPSNLFLAKVSSGSRETSDPNARTLTSFATSVRYTVKVLDLGLARLQSDSPSQAALAATALTQSGQILGTPDYMAPEQWDDTHAVDHRADLYALGCTLFFLLTGRAPFADGTRNSIMSKLKAHAIDEIPDLVAVAHATRVSPSTPAIPADLNALYQRLMAKQPESRPANAAEVAAELKTIIQRLRSEHRPPSSPVAPRQESRTSLDSARATNPQSTTDVTRAPGNPVAERQGYDDATAPLDFFAQLQADADCGARGSRATEATVELRTTPGAREPRAPQTRRLRIAAALVGCVVLAGLLIKLMQPAGPTADRGMAAPGRPAVPNNAANTKSTATEKNREDKTAEGGHPTDPDRAAAEWVLAQSNESNRVAIMPLSGGGGNRTIQRGEPLPNEPFRVTVIGISKANITDADLARYLPRLDKLYHLRLSSCPVITNAAVKTLRELATLTNLEIGGTPISGSGCLELAKALPLLQFIAVFGNQFSPELREFI